jgi:transcriptional regulator with XRE-family HTH domain
MSSSFVDNDVASYIKRFRKEKRISQLELEVGIDIAEGSVSRIENGRVTPSSNTLRKISEFLELSPAQISKLYSVNIGYFSNLIGVTSRTVQASSIEKYARLAFKAVGNFIPKLRFKARG